MLKLDEENRIAVPTGPIEDSVYVFPSFQDMKAATARLLKRKIVVSGTNVSNKMADERVRMFDTTVLRTEGLPARSGEEVVEMSILPDWTAKIPTNAKIAATSPFDELVAAEIDAAEVFGDPVFVTVDAIFGELRFEFPTMEEMAPDLKFLMSDRIRQRGRRVQDRSNEVRMSFFRKTCRGVEGVAIPNGAILATVLPENWILSAVRPFERQEALSEDDLGN